MKMSASIELLDTLKASFGGLSDYAAARKIGVTQQSISQIRNGATKFSTEKALFICELADLNAGEWLLRLYKERAKCDAEKETLDMLINRMVA